MSTHLRFLYRAAVVILFTLPNWLFAQSGGSALSFDGSDDYVQVRDDPSLDMTTGVTIAAWIFLDSYTEWASIVTKGGIVDDGDELTPNNYTVHQSGPSAASGEYGHLRFTTGFGLAGDSHSIIPLHEWHHVAVTFDGTFVRFYLDGQADGGVFFPGSLPPNDDPLHIGVDFPGGDEYWHGRIDELMIFNRALTRDNIRALRDGDRPSNLAGFWRFNEGSGSIAHDRSGRENHGRLFGNPAWVTPGAPLHLFSKELAGEFAEQTAGEFLLMSNYPNPFNPETEIRFQLPEAGHVVVKIFNTLGAEIRTLMDDRREAGYHAVRWDGKDRNGNPVASGLYFYQLQTAAFSQVRKMNLLR